MDERIGKIISGRRGYPVYGIGYWQAGRILYEDLRHILVVISWIDGEDVDIRGNFTGSSAFIGWSQGAQKIEEDGFYARWRGDQMSGGPEYIDLYASQKATIENKRFDIRCNWYRIGSTHAGGPVTITAVDENGTSIDVSFQASRREHEKASASDPGAQITFDKEGNLIGMVRIS